MPIVLAHLGPKVPLNFRDTHESSSSSSGSGGVLPPAPALAFIARRWRPTGLSSPPPGSVGVRILGSDDWTELHIVLYRGGSLWADLDALTTDKVTTECPTDHHPRDIRRTPRLRHHPNPRHRPINGHLNTRSCTEPPRRPGNSRQLCLGIQQNPLLGRLSAAIYSWGSQVGVTVSRRLLSPKRGSRTVLSPDLARRVRVAVIRRLPDGGYQVAAVSVLEGDCQPARRAGESSPAWSAA